MNKKASFEFVPEASGTRDFVVLGSESGFMAMLGAGAALAIIAVIAIILFIRKILK